MGLFSLIQDPKVFEERVLRRVLRPKEEKVTGGCKKLSRVEHGIFLFFLWLFCLFPGHGLHCFHLRFQNNSALRGRVVNPTPNTYIEDQDFLSRLNSPRGTLRLAAPLKPVRRR
jgi:hypothetical protein